MRSSILRLSAFFVAIGLNFSSVFADDFVDKLTVKIQSISRGPGGLTLIADNDFRECPPAVQYLIVAKFLRMQEHFDIDELPNLPVVVYDRADADPTSAIKANRRKRTKVATMRGVREETFKSLIFPPGSESITSDEPRLFTDVAPRNPAEAAELRRQLEIQEAEIEEDMRAGIRQRIAIYRRMHFGADPPWMKERLREGR